MELDRLLPLLNGWWSKGRVGADLLKDYRRDAFGEIERLVVDYRPITLITGLRRVGKTTLIFQLIGRLIERGTDPRKILYFSFDEQSEKEIIAILDAFQKSTGTDWTEERVFVFLDEIQKLEGWGAKAKLVYDSFPKVKLILSGSASLQLEKEAMYDLAGRHFSAEVEPLSLKEYFELRSGKRIGGAYPLYRREISLEFEAYMKRPFPEIVKYDDEMRVSQYIRETILTKVVRVDLPDAFKGVDVPLLNRLLDIFYAEPGMLLNVDSLARDLKVWKKTLERHIFFLEFSKLIRIVRNFRVSARSESRKLRKVYPYHISLAYSFGAKIEMGKAAESLVASSINAKNYWREKDKEVDFIIRDGKGIVPLEVKYKAGLDSNDLKTLHHFIERFKVGKGFVAYLGNAKSFSGGIEGINLVDFIFDPGTLLGAHASKGAPVSGKSGRIRRQ